MKVGDGWVTEPGPSYAEQQPAERRILHTNGSGSSSLGRNLRLLARWFLTHPAELKI